MEVRPVQAFFQACNHIFVHYCRISLLFSFCHYIKRSNIAYHYYQYSALGQRSNNSLYVVAVEFVDPDEMQSIVRSRSALSKHTSNGQGCGLWSSRD